MSRQQQSVKIKPFINSKFFCIALSALLSALQGPAGAQQTAKVPRIGYLSSASPSATLAPGAFRQALRELGYVEGKNIVIEQRYAELKLDRLPDLAAELVRLKVDIIVAAGGINVIRAAKNATETIPIVMGGSGIDPVVAGLVESLAHPGRNVTGITNLTRENWEANGWSCSKKRFPTLPVSRFSMSQPIRGVYAS